MRGTREREKKNKSKLAWHPQTAPFWARGSSPEAPGPGARIPRVLLDPPAARMGYGGARTRTAWLFKEEEEDHGEQTRPPRPPPAALLLLLQGTERAPRHPRARACCCIALRWTHSACVRGQRGSPQTQTTTRGCEREKRKGRTKREGGVGAVQSKRATCVRVVRVERWKGQNLQRSGNETLGARDWAAPRRLFTRPLSTAAATRTPVGAADDDDDARTLGDT
jgi:hypothetical protein